MKQEKALSLADIKSVKQEFMVQYVDEKVAHPVDEETVRLRLENYYQDIDLCVDFMRENPNSKMSNPYAFYWFKGVTK